RSVLATWPGRAKPWTSWGTWTLTRHASTWSMSTACLFGGYSGCWPATWDPRQRPGRQPEDGTPGSHPHSGPARLLLPGPGPVPGRRVGRGAAHRRAGVLGRGNPYSPLRAATVAPGRGLRAGRAGHDRGGRATRQAGRGGRGQPGLRPGTTV